MYHILEFFIGGSNKNTVSIETDEDILTKLKYIGNLPQGIKIDSYTLRYESNSIFSSIRRRFFTGDDRDNALNLFTRIINRSFEILNCCFCNSSKMYDKLRSSYILQDIVKSIDGLREFQKTYNDDAYFFCKIQITIESVMSRILEIKQTRPNLFQNIKLPFNDDIKEEDKKKETLYLQESENNEETYSSEEKNEDY